MSHPKVFSMCLLLGGATRIELPERTMMTVAGHDYSAPQTSSDVGAGTRRMLQVADQSMIIPCIRYDVRLCDESPAIMKGDHILVAHPTCIRPGPGCLLI